MDRDKHNLHLAPFSFVAEYASKKKKKKEEKEKKKSHSFGLFFALIGTTAHNETFFALSHRSTLVPTGSSSFAPSDHMASWRAQLRRTGYIASIRTQSDNVSYIFDFIYDIPSA